MAGDLLAGRLRRAWLALTLLRPAYRNWPSVALSLALRHRARAVARDGTVVEGGSELVWLAARWLAARGRLACVEVLRAPPDPAQPARFRARGREAILYGWLESSPRELDDYCSLLHVEGRSVLDVGAYVGDSAILFALMGARRVVAVEPSPWAYNVARRNVEVNGLGDVVELVNCAVAREGGRTLMLPTTETGVGFSALAAAGGDAPVPTCTLDSLIEKYGPFDVLKMDCEGCEHESIPYSRRVGEVREILVEYHGGYGDVVRRLREEGFEVWFSSISAGRRLRRRPRGPRLGYVYALRPSA